MLQMTQKLLLAYAAVSFSSFTDTPPRQPCESTVSLGHEIWRGCVDPTLGVSWNCCAMPSLCHAINRGRDGGIYATTANPLYYPGLCREHPLTAALHKEDSPSGYRKSGIFAYHIDGRPHHINEETNSSQWKPDSSYLVPLDPNFAKASGL